jgi:hypothetical protein
MPESFDLELPLDGGIANSPTYNPSLPSTGLTYGVEKQELPLSISYLWMSATRIDIGSTYSVNQTARKVNDENAKFH